MPNFKHARASQITAAAATKTVKKEPIFERFKYVAGDIKDQEGDMTRAALVFPLNILHRDVGRLFTKVTGAGFALIDGDKIIVCFNKSESLNIGPNTEEDRVLIAKAVAHTESLY